MRRNAGHRPQGAILQPDGSVAWRLWAPHSDAVWLVTTTSGGREEIAMTAEEDGYFIHQAPCAEAGLRYGYRLSDGREYPDPASRWQPEGVHKPSAVFFPESFEWSDQRWRGVAREDLVIYELHVGAFTPAGTFEAIVPRLSALLELGVTAIELMPVAQFPGARNWGYDGVFPFAVQNSYGGPRGLQRLVDAAHRVGMAVLLDVVYNHLGPEGNYFERFGPYFTDRHHTPWGKAVNFDGPQSDPVRRFFIDNACMWVRDFHVDGLRLDAVHAIFDLGAYPILAEIQDAVQREADGAGRRVHVIAETNQNDVRLVGPRRRGGCSLDAAWSDDFHHAVHALLTGERDGYYLDFGQPEQLVKTYRKVFAYDGCYSPFHRRRHGNRVGRTDRTRFVVCIQNHDQVGNRACGDRLAALVGPPAARLAAGLLMLSPCVPLLFMGEEYGELHPFPFFCSFDDPQIINAVRRGRRREFAALSFAWRKKIPDAQSPETFASARLDWQWPDGSEAAKRRRLYRDLLQARRRWPALGDRRRTDARTWNSGDSVLLLLERGGDTGLLAVANLSDRVARLPANKVADKKILLSTEDVRYGGVRDTLLPSPDQPSVGARRGAGGEGVLRRERGEGRGEREITQSPNLQISKIELFPYELLIFDLGGGRP